MARTEPAHGFRTVLFASIRVYSGWELKSAARADDFAAGSPRKSLRMNTLRRERWGQL